MGSIYNRVNSLVRNCIDAEEAQWMIDQIFSDTPHINDKDELKPILPLRLAEKFPKKLRLPL